MANEEIVSGLKNAIERGFSLDSAVRSFINAGYNPSEVQQAASMISSGVSTIMPIQQDYYETNIDSKSQTPPSPIYQPRVKNKGRTWVVVLLSVILILLLIGLAAIIFFKDKIISFF